MKDITKMTITVDRRQEYKGSEILYTDLRVWLRMETMEDAPGLRWISFLLMGDEGRDLFAGRAGLLVDGYHLLKCFGELWTFFDDGALYGNASAGEATIPYRRVTVPVHVQEIILGEIDQAIEQYDGEANAKGERTQIVLDFTDRLGEWADYYGQGKGRIVVDGPEDEIEALKGEKTFDRSWATIAQIALNTTHSKDDTAPVRIYRESPTGFLWNAGRMHGGLINHGTVESPDWSIHT